jgi:hypothetical protein
MALQISLDSDTSPNGNASPSAYVRIVLFTFDIKTDMYFCVLEFHHNAAARQNGKNPIKGASYHIDGAAIPDTGGIRNNLYTYLKTLPEFAGAIDV